MKQPRPISEGLRRGLELGALGKDLVGLKCRTGDLSQRKARVRRMVDRLGLLHGLPQKIGQLLAFSDLSDSSPDFARLTESDSCLTADEAFAEIERQLGSPLSTHFREVAPRGISASIGQVHHAVCHDGREVAIKLQHPGIADALQWDLRALGWLTAPIGDLRRGFDLPSYRQEIGTMLLRELDFTLEAQSIEEFRNRCGGWPSLDLPSVFSKLSGPKLLVTSWVQGDRLPAAASWPLAERQILADTILRLFLQGLFRWRLLHADPNPGNYRFQSARSHGVTRLGLLDFGCVKAVSPDLAHALARLIEAAIEGRLEADFVWDCFLEMGFSRPALGALRERLVGVAEILCEPFRNAAPFSNSQWALGERLAACLGEERMTFRTAGPADLLFVIRTFQGVLKYLAHLQVATRWRDLFLECRPECPSAPESVRPTRAHDDAMKSESLHILVREAAQTKISLTFDAKAADHLEELVPRDLKETLSRRCIDLSAVVERARGSNYEPGNLFSWEEGNKSVRVWLA